MEAASSIAMVERDAPFVRWLEQVIEATFSASTVNAIRLLDVQSCPEELRDGWREYSLPFALWCPLQLADGRSLGGLWLAREEPWQERETTLGKRLADTYAHAWNAFGGGKKSWTRRRRTTIAVTLLVVLLLGLLPVRMSALAPMEVVSHDPVIVSAPMDGVIAELAVPPNVMVEQGDVLLSYEDTNLRNNLEVAEKTLAVTNAELRKASQGAFGDARSKAQVALLQAQVELSAAKRDYAQELLNQVNVTALKSGLVIYTDEADWVGRPVVVGERIMQIADPEDVELRIDLAVKDAIVSADGAPVRVFLDIDPIHSIAATLTHTSYEAEVTESDVLAYRLAAVFDESQARVRIGLQGTAKVYGEKTTLFYYLFRRPISAARQFFGL